MNRKHLSVGLMVGLALTLMVAPVFGTGSEENEDGTAHIRATMWIGEPASIDALDELTAMYVESHPDTSVEWINIAGGGPFGRDKLQTMIAGGDAPDLMQLNTGQFEGFAARNALYGLDALVERDNLDLSIYWPQAISGSTYDGTLYGLPIDVSNHILFYNQDLFDAAGIAYPDDSWTWDDLLAAAQALTVDKDGDGRTDQWGFGLNNTVWAWAGFVYANGGAVLSDDRSEYLLDSPEAIEALEFFFDLQNEHQVSPPPGSLPEQGWAGDWMLTESVAMGIFGPWWRPAMASAERGFRWDVAFPPKSPNTGERGSVIYTDQWSMSSTTEVADETWEFMKFLSSEEGQRTWAELGGSRSISPVKSVTEADEWLHYGGSTGEIIVDTIAFSQVPPVDFANANEVENIWNQEFGLVLAGEATVEEAVATIGERVGPVLAESE